LAHHGWIPEPVYTTTSASAKRSREFHAPIGSFHYVRIAATPFLTGVERIHSADESYFLASPWRAVVDYLWTRHKEWRGLKPLVQDLRIAETRLHQTTAEELAAIAAAFGRRRVSHFLAGARKELYR
ncbi:MAG: hypothetical protein HYV03_00500, partial [Deltaproteobacteria bacterium]|nr:hypothetical protein [Deltaproteobacteria bacterium]